eukprot:jgi/Tetstr1/420696/TSEL_011781.t1
MPAGPSSQASAATTRVSTQLQNFESEVKYLLKRATERCWREVVNRQKEVEKELRSQLAVAERARVEADILRRKRDKKVARLKAKIRLMCESNGSEAESAGIGDDDSWQYVYAEGGPGAQFGAPSGGDEGAEQQQQQGDVDAHGADGEEVGIVEEADLVGQPADVRAAHTPRFILGALLANYPELLASILESKQFKHHLKAAERRTLLAIRKLWEHNDVHVHTDLKLSQDAFQRLINLSSSKWDADMEKRLLLKEGFIKPGESLSIQLVADATEIFNCLGTGHVAKVKREKHEQTHASLKRKFPEHTFENTSRAAKK